MSGVQKNFSESFDIPRLTESEHQQEPRFSRLKIFSHDGTCIHQCFSTSWEPVDWEYLTTWEICCEDDCDARSQSFQNCVMHCPIHVSGIDPLDYDAGDAGVDAGFYKTAIRF